MVLLIIITGSILAVIGKLIEKKTINPLTVFCTMFVLICFGASLRLFGLNAAKDSTYAVVLVGVLLYGMGYLFASICKFRLSANNNSIKYEYVLNYKIVYFLSAIAIIYLLSLAGMAINYLMKGYSLKYIRFSLFGNSESEFYSQSTLQYTIRYYIIQPITSLLPILCVVDVFYGRKDKKLILFSLVSLGLTIVSSGGRLPILYLIMNIVVLYSVLNRKIHLSQKAKRIVLITTGLLLGVILYITLARDITEIVSNYYKYFVGCIPHLEIYLDKIHAANYTANGASTFKAPLQLFFLVLKTLKIIPEYPEWFNTLADYTNMRHVVYIGVGDGMRYNGFVTVFYYFFLDYGYLGVALFSFVLGFAAKNVYRNARKYTNIRNLAFLCMLFQIVIVSFARFELSIARYFLVIILIIICCRKRNMPWFKGLKG